MAWRPHPRKARTSQSSPRAWATCQRCGFVANLVDLQYQFQWRGTRLVNTQILVCVECLDDPQRQLGTVILPPDPVAVKNARPEAYPIDEIWPRLTEAGQPRYLEANPECSRSLEEALYFSTGGPDNP